MAQEFDPAGRTSYRVDVLTPNRGPDNAAPVALPALKTDAQPLRFLDFLIYRAMQAVALYGPGISINVPAPERYALHKRLVSRLCIATTESQAKSCKDLHQAGELMTALVDSRPYNIKALTVEITGRGPRWPLLATQALTPSIPLNARNWKAWSHNRPCPTAPPMLYAATSLSRRGIAWAMPISGPPAIGSKHAAL